MVEKGVQVMLKERVQARWDAGENCSRTILLAAAEEYGISLSADILSACSGIQGGFGIGGICSGLVAAVMVLGLLFEEETAKVRRLQFLMQIQERYGFLDCGRLSLQKADCSVLLSEIAEILQDIIET